MRSTVAASVVVVCRNSRTAAAKVAKLQTTPPKLSRTVIPRPIVAGSIIHSFVVMDVRIQRRILLSALAIALTTARARSGERRRHRLCLPHDARPAVARERGRVEHDPALALSR